jgi:FkbM family methyltransferase
MADQPDTIIYGTGSVAARFVAENIATLGRIVFASTQGGGEFRGQPVLNAQAIAHYPDATVIVASSFRRQILATLTEIGIDDRRIRWYIAEQDRLASTDEIRMLWTEHAQATSLRDRTRLILHHVGGRGFGVALTAPARFARDLVYVLYEADAECAREMSEINPHENFHILPYCLGRRSGPARLNIMSNACNSSVLEPAATYFPYHCEVSLSGREDGVDLAGAPYDVILGNDMRVVRQVDVETRTLDELIAAGKLPYGAPPDVLSLDTQGAELDILLGARQTVRAGVLALATEIGFHQIYSGQPLFARLLDFADAEGFHFVAFAQLQEMSPYRAPIGQRGKGLIGFGDAMFLRRIETLDGLTPDPELRRIKGYKLAFIALTQGCLEYAVQAFDYAAQQPSARTELAETVYAPFLDRLRETGASMPRLYLHNDRSELIKELRQRGSILPAPSTDENPLAAPVSPLEAVLAEYGFTELAETIRDRRRRDLPFAKQSSDTLKANWSPP